MNILNICINAPFNIGFSYQENLLPKYHRLNGNDVTVFAPEFEYSQDGTLRKSDIKESVDGDGVVVKRIPIRNDLDINSKFKRFINLYEEIEKVKPDIIFCHLFQFLDLNSVIKYIKKHPDVNLYIDSHADFFNSASNYLSQKVLHGIIWKRLAHKALPYTEKFFGVTPARVDFLLNVYGLPQEKVELLPLGADDVLVQKAAQSEVKNSLREKLGVSKQQTLIISGGKIDHNKPQTLDLMRAINIMKDDSIHLAVFGSVNEKLKDEFNSELSEYVSYMGWKNIDEIYDIFSAADLIVFPGLHSVLWEQAVGVGKPCIFKKIPGFDHIDLGGNCMFFEKDTADEYISVIKQAMVNIDRMSDIAEKRGMETFSYRNIAKKSIGVL